MTNPIHGRARADDMFQMMIGAVQLTVLRSARNQLIAEKKMAWAQARAWATGGTGI